MVGNGFIKMGPNGLTKHPKRGQDPWENTTH